MIKTCGVIWKNEQVAVVDFDGILVQVPSQYLSDGEITLEKDGVSFYICDNEETETEENDFSEDIEDDDIEEDDDTEENA